MLGRILAAAFTAALIAPAAAHADTSGLVAAYGVEETIGTTVIDSSAMGNGGTLSGAVRSTAGRYGGALSFDGSDDKVTVADSNSLDLASGMTLEAWVKPTAATAGKWRTVVLKEQPAALAYALYSDEGAARPSVHAFTTREYDTRGTSAAPLNTWTHLAATYDGATLRLYVNGSQVSSRALTGALRSTSGVLSIGGNAVWGEYYKGLIDEVRVYNRALTTAEIGADMTAPVVAPNAPPSAPTDLEATVERDDVSLRWGPAADDVAVTGYRVHRAATAGFTPSDANGIATVTGTSHVDVNRPVGTAYYRVVAVDSAGQAGAPSNEASATVAADTTPPIVAIDEACPLTLSANDAIFGTVEDDSGAQPEVVLYLDGTRLKRASWGGTGHWYAEWDTYLTPNGTYSLTAVARDAAGNETTSAPCQVTIDNPPIELSFLSPADGATVSGIVRVEAVALVGGEPLSGDIWLEIDGEKVTPIPVRRFDWDTRLLQDGSTHTLTAIAFSGYLNDPPYKTTSIQVTVDNTENEPPTAPANLQASVDDDDVTLTWSPSTDNVGVETYRVYRSATPGFTPSDANLVRSQPGTSWVDGARPTGTWYYKVRAFDGVGNVSAASNEASAEVLPDTTPPELTLAGDCPRTVERFARFSGTSTDNRTPPASVLINLKLDGVTIPPYAQQNGGAGAGNRYNWDWDTRYTPNGTYTITVVGRDAAGNETSLSCEVTVDNVPLAAGFTSLTDGGTAPAGTVPVTVAQTSGLECGCWIRLKIDGNVKGLFASLPATYSWDTSSLAIGSEHTLTAELLPNYPDDPPYATTTIHVTIRLAAPVVTATTSLGEVRLAWDRVNGATTFRVHRSTTPGFTPGDDNLVSTTGTWNGTTDFPGTGGTYYYRVVAADGAGGRSAPSNEVAATLPPDTDPPYGLSVRVDTIGCQTVRGAVKVFARAFDDYGAIASLQIRLDGEDLGAPITNTAGALVDWDTRTVADGPHVLTLVARDASGNEATSAACDVTVDNEASAPPTVSITAPASGATVSGTVPVTANAADDDGVTSVQFKLDGGNLGAADTSAPFSVSWNTATATAGAHRLTAVARDAEGQTTTSDPVDVTVENLPTGLSAAYGFEEASGNAVTDSSGNGNAGTIAGATRAAAGRYGAALSFDGAGDLVTVADAPELDLSTAGSIEAWVRPAAIGGSWRTVAMKARPGGLAYALYAGADAPRPSANVWAGGSEAEASGPAQLPLNAWSHVAVTYDSIALKLYVDGTAVATRALTAPIVTSTGALTIGGNTVWTEWFNGLIDEVRVYERALTAAEIRADRDRPVVP
jgi:fibronectin type 3 domain-containing protein